MLSEKFKKWMMKFKLGIAVTVTLVLLIGLFLIADSHNTAREQQDRYKDLLIKHLVTSCRKIPGFTILLKI